MQRLARRSENGLFTDAGAFGTYVHVCTTYALVQACLRCGTGMARACHAEQEHSMRGKPRQCFTTYFHVCGTYVPRAARHTRGIYMRPPTFHVQLHACAAYRLGEHVRGNHVYTFACTLAAAAPPCPSASGQVQAQNIMPGAEQHIMTQTAAKHMSMQACRWARSNIQLLEGPA
jgi:hypothetical protein